VVVRLIDLAVSDQALAQAEASLTPEELARARRGAPAVHRRRVILRGALRSALAAELGLPARHVPLVTSPDGRPGLAVAAGGRTLDVSCSASGGLGVVVLGRGRRLGVDLEQVAPWSSGILDEGWLCRSEQDALAALPPMDRSLAATRCWTQKEAVLKARGTGLRGNPAATVTVVGRRTGVVAGFAVCDVPVPDGWVASLAVGRQEKIPA